MEKEMKKIEKRLWKEIGEEDVNLYGALNKLTKEELDDIRRSNDIKNMSGLKKGDLAKALSEEIPGRVKDVFYMIDAYQYEYFKSMKDQGYVEYTDENLMSALFFMYFGVLYSGTYDGNRIIYVPKEIIEEFDRIDGENLVRNAELRANIVDMIHGAVHYYGIVSLEDLVPMIENNLNISFISDMIMGMISDIIEIYGRIDFNDYGIYDATLDNPESVLKDQESRPEISHRIFTKDELISAGKHGFVEETNAVKDFMRVLVNDFKMPSFEANAVVLECVDLIKYGSGVNAILMHLQEHIKLSGEKEVGFIASQIQELNNTTRLWALKGNAPIEVSGVIESATQAKSQKIGRNDPCMCGSQKKYKRCCGAIA
jgi:hypothetical protein